MSVRRSTLRESTAAPHKRHVLLRLHTVAKCGDLLKGRVYETQAKASTVGKTNACTNA